jgi:hypothetical protein
MYRFARGQCPLVLWYGAGEKPYGTGIVDDSTITKGQAKKAESSGSQNRQQ